MIIVSHNTGFKWNISGNVRVKGIFFDTKENLLSQKLLIEYFKNASDFKDFIKLLKESNGIFSVIIEKKNEIWCAVDRNISFPIFYLQINNDLVISDNPEVLVEKIKQPVVNEFQKSIFRSMGHTLGENTLIEGIKNIECAQAIRIVNGEIVEKVFYHDFAVKQFFNYSYHGLYKKGNQVFIETFNRLIKSLDGRTAVVPLSGGFDSRLIVAAFRKLNYKNVICFTYGRKTNNPELSISKKVADRLGYKWIFVEYTKDLFNDYHLTKEFIEYIHFAGHYSSMFYLQEYFAVKYLKENKLIPYDSVFIPGHSGDLIGGSQLVKVYNKYIKLNEISQQYIAKKTIYNDLDSYSMNRLNEFINEYVVNNNSFIAPTIFEEIDIKEKISKVIFNSSLVFDYFGYQKRFPFWDTHLLNFFFPVPIEYREMKKLYDDILINEYFKPFNIFFENELQPDKKKILIQSFKNKIKQLLPKKHKESILQRNDWKNYYEATAPLLLNLRNSNYNFYYNFVSFNEILIAFYLKEIENHLTINTNTTRI